VADPLVVQENAQPSRDDVAGLYSFQVEGVDHLKGMRARLIGDEMGIGKTYEAIALDVANRANPAEGAKSFTRTLVVCPLSMVDTWREKWTELVPGRKVVTCDPKNRHEFETALLNNQHTVFICHWEALRLLPTLGKITFFHVIADECHRAKNRKAQQTRALKAVKTFYKTAMSGTPADNKPQDLWSILNWLWPTKYTAYWKFYKAFIKYEVQYPQGYHKIIGVQNMEILHAEMKPWYIRRLKRDVLKDLPDKYYTDLWVDLAPKQRVAYDQMKKDLIAWVGEHENEPLVAPVVIAQLIRLQQFAAGYMQYDKESGKWMMSEPSAKLDALMELLEDHPDEQFVVFDNFKGPITLLARRLEAANVSYRVLTGDTKQEDRGRAVQDFQEGRARIFLGTIAAGGVGISLTAASTVVFLNRNWSPALNLQAEDRPHRIGQKNAVQVIDIIARNTVDLGKRQRVVQKWSWIRSILGDDVREIQRGEDDEAA
jgi:SNF2 family DNA or RNA helicase